MNRTEIIKSRLIDQDYTLVDGPVLSLHNYTIGLQSNSPALLKQLEEYFAPVLGNETPDITVTMIERDTVNMDDIDLEDWKREPGKSGRKDAFSDLGDARLIQKVRTGMVFLQCKEAPIAAGPCIENDNQVINFINAQYMNHLQQNGALILHASGLVHHGKALGIAGFSGGGKSTLMLHMLGADHMDYLTNDRLFVQQEDHKLLALGIPKLPRINPGTIINNDRLRSMLPETRIQELKAMGKDQLWDLEEKYDVNLHKAYDKDKIPSAAPLGHFLILNWTRDSQSPCTIEKVDLTERRDLLPAIMKSPGPFYQDATGVFFKNNMKLDEQAYLDNLKGVNIYEATGNVDFAHASATMLGILDGDASP